MAWKESDGAGGARLDFSHPRVAAAMKVTGIQESDLSGKPSDKLANGDSDLAHKSKELYETRRRRLLRELENAAEALEDDDVAAILAESGADGSHGQSFYDVHKVQVDKMRERLQAQLQRQARREIERAEKTEAAEQKRDEAAKRLREMQEEHRAELAAQAEKREAQHMKVQERVRQGARTAREWRKEITEKISQSNERVEAVAKQRRNGETGKQKELQNRIARIVERKMDTEQAQLQTSLQRYEEALQRGHEVEQRLTSARQEVQHRAQERRGRFSSKMGLAQDTQEQQKKDREKTLVEKAKKLEAARELKIQREQEMAENAKTARDKQVTKWQTNRQGLREKRREWLAQMTAGAADAHKKTQEVRERYMEEGIRSYMANRAMYRDVAEANQARLLRMDECARGQMLAKMERDLTHIASVQEQKQKIQDYRASVIKESMTGKVRVEELKEANMAHGEQAVKRTNELLQELGLPPKAAAVAKEGEETQQQ